MRRAWPACWDEWSGSGVVVVSGECWEPSLDLGERGGAMRRGELMAIEESGGRSETGIVRQDGHPVCGSRRGHEMMMR
jgi:hypothetical protein